MKNVLTIALVTIGLGFSAVTLAGHDRDRHHNGYHNQGKHRVVVQNHYHGNKHWKKQRHYNQPRAYYRHDYHPQRYARPYRGRTYVVNHHDHDDLYKWIGGIYLLNEVLHHDRH